MKFNVTAALVTLCLAGTASADYRHPQHDEIVAKMKLDDAVHVMAIPALKARAQNGDLRAMYALSLRYQNGIDVKRNWDEYQRLSKRIQQLAPAAFTRGDPYGAYQVALQGSLLDQWSDERRFAAYLVAAQAGSADAAESVGWAYYWGRGVRKDLAEAKRWYRIGALGGNCQAIRNLAVMYASPESGQSDTAEAVKWYRIAAENSYACGNGAVYALATIFSKGAENVAVDHREALIWLTETVKRGNPVGAMQIGFYHEKGLGTPVNKAEALKWFKIAGYPSVNAARAELRRLGVPEPE